MRRNVILLSAVATLFFLCVPLFVRTSARTLYHQPSATVVFFDRGNLCIFHEPSSTGLHQYMHAVSLGGGWWNLEMWRSIYPRGPADTWGRPAGWVRSAFQLPVVLFALPPAALGAYLTGAFSLRRDRRRQRGQCLNCGYDLRGSPGRACSECGNGFDPNEAQAYATMVRTWSRRRWPLTLSCLIVYAVLCTVAALLNLGGLRLGEDGLAGPLNLLDVRRVGDIVALLVTAFCSAVIVAFPIRPRRSTAVLMIVGFGLWYYAAWYALWVLA
jgi:hypothetical protein